MIEEIKKLSRLGSVCISCPNRSGKDRCVGILAWLGELPFLLHRILFPSLDAAAQSSGKSGSVATLQSPLDRLAECSSWRLRLAVYLVYDLYP
jgi:hypothetical protein